MPLESDDSSAYADSSSDSSSSGSSGVSEGTQSSASHFDSDTVCSSSSLEDESSDDYAASDDDNVPELESSSEDQSDSSSAEVDGDDDAQDSDNEDDGGSRSDSSSSVAESQIDGEDDDSDSSTAPSLLSDSESESDTDEDNGEETSPSPPPRRRSERLQAKAAAQEGQRRSARAWKPSLKYLENQAHVVQELEPQTPERRQEHEHLSKALMAFIVMHRDPTTRLEAMQSAKWFEWHQAEREEFDALLANNTWILVERGPGMNVLDPKWVYKTKVNDQGEIERYKARLCVKRFQEKPQSVPSSTYASTLLMTTVRIIFAPAAILGYTVHLIDIKNAFLFAYVKHTKDGTTVYIAAFVDDVLLHVKALLKEFFKGKITDKGRVTLLLGIQIEWTDEGILLHHQNYIERLLGAQSFVGIDRRAHNQKWTSRRITEGVSLRPYALGLDSPKNGKAHQLHMRYRLGK